MLSNRSDRTQSGHKLSVGVAYPKRYVLQRLVRGLTIKSAVLGGLLGFGHAFYVHSTKARAVDNGIAQIALESLAGAGIGAAAGLTGSLSYAFIGGAPGAAVGVLGVGLIGGGSLAALPSIAALPGTLGVGQTRVAAGESGGAGDQSLASDDAAVVPGQTDDPSAPVFADDDVKEEAPPVAPLYRGPFNDRVVYLGMNVDATRTATRSLSRRAEVTTITDEGPQDRVRSGGKLYDLRSKAGIAAFVASLGLPAKNAAGARTALEMCEQDAKDELAELAMIWARGEKGDHIPSRLVLAGHSNGDGVWGDNNGSLRLGPLLELSRALPHATAQIEDAFVTGCYGGGEVTMDQYRLILPRAKTIWAYDAQAPGVDNGATLDQGTWESATRGRKYQTIDGPSASAGKHMAVWNKSGYHAAKADLDLNALRGKVQWMEEHFYRPAFRGEAIAYDGEQRIPIRITDPHTGLVRQYYSWLVRLTQEPSLPEDERVMWVEKKHQTIRLLYFAETVAPAFARHYRQEIARGYAKIGLKAPDYARLSRAAALREIAAFETQLQKQSNAPGDSKHLADLLERGLSDLDPLIVRDGWV